MREFVLLALKAWTSPDFVIENNENSGKMSLVCSAISNTMAVSHAMRKDTAMHIVMTGPKLPPKLISIYGGELQSLNPDERAISEMIRDCLKAGATLELNQEKEVFPGIIVAKKALETLLKERSGVRQLVYLHPKGEDIRKFDIKGNESFIFGDFIGMPKNTEKFMDRLGAKKISLGPKMLFAAHCPIIVHNELDRHEKQPSANQGISSGARDCLT